MTEKTTKTWILPVTLAVVSMIMGFLICGAYLITKTPIETQATAARESARRKVLPAAVTLTEISTTETDPVDFCYAGSDASGALVGYVSQITVNGFGGPIELTVGMDCSAVITGLSVGGSDFSETSGLGAKTKEPAFTDQFTGKSGLLVLKDNIDSVTGASVSSGAVVGGVNAAVAFMSALLPTDSSAAVESLPLTAEELASLLPGDTVTFMGTAAGIDGWWQGSTGYIVQATGYGHGPIVVKMAFDEYAVCKGIVIGDENFSEGEGYGARVLEPTYWQQFIGKSGVQTYGSGVDAVSGATSSSNGTLSAINACMSFDPAAALSSAVSAPAAVSAEADTASSTEASAQPVSTEPTATPVPTVPPTPVPTAVPSAGYSQKATQDPPASSAPTAAAAVPTPDAVSEASVTEAAAVPAAAPTPTPAPTAVPTPVPTTVPDAVSEASAAK